MQDFQLPIARASGALAIAGAMTMLAGAVFYNLAGADLWSCLAKNEMAGYLQAVGAAKGLLTANLSLWIAGVIMLGIAGLGMCRLNEGRTVFAISARLLFMTAVPLAVAAFIGMAAIVIKVAPDTSEIAVKLATTIG